MGAGPAHAAHFGMYEFVREIAGGRGDGWGGVGGTAVAGAAATITSDALMNPFDGELHDKRHRCVICLGGMMGTRYTALNLDSSALTNGISRGYS